MSEGAFFSESVAVWRVQRRRSQKLVRAALALFVWPVVAGLLLLWLWYGLRWGEAVHEVLGLAWLASWLIAVPIAALLSWRAAGRRRQPVRSVQVRDGGLRLDLGARRWVIRAADIEGAVVVKHVGASEAEIALRSGDVLVLRGERAAPAPAGDRPVQPGERTASAIVTELGFVGAKRRTVMEPGEPRAALQQMIRGTILSAPAVLAAMVAGGATSRPLGLKGDAVPLEVLTLMGLTFLSTMLLTARPWAARRVVVGADGVLVESALGRRFFRRSEIVDVERIGGAAVLRIARGDKVESVELTAEGGGRQQALIERIREVLAEKAPADSEPRAELLARGSDSLSAWRERLRKLVAKGESYRAHALPAEVLVRTVADAQAPADVRVGAALAIALSGDAEAKKLLRIAQGAIASEKLRVAIEAAGDGLAEEEAIAAACEEAGTWSTGRR